MPEFWHLERVLVLLRPLIGDDVAADQNRAGCDVDHADQWHRPEGDCNGAEDRHPCDHLPSDECGSAEEVGLSQSDREERGRDCQNGAYGGEHEIDKSAPPDNITQRLDGVELVGREPRLQEPDDRVELVVRDREDRERQVPHSGHGKRDAEQGSCHEEKDVSEAHFDSPSKVESG